MILLLWLVCGGFLFHMLECNYLTILLKPTYEKPVNGAEDILDRGLTVVNYPGSESLVKMLRNSPNKISRELAENTIVAKVIFCNIDKVGRR